MLLLLHVLSIFHNGRRDLSKLETTGSVPLLSQFYVQVIQDSDCFDPVSYVNLTIIVLTVLSADQKSRCKYRIKKNKKTTCHLVRPVIKLIQGNLGGLANRIAFIRPSLWSEFSELYSGCQWLWQRPRTAWHCWHICRI